MKHVFITGATGFLGANLVRAILKNSDAVLYLLVRETAECPAAERIKNLMAKIFSQEQRLEYLPRVHAVKGDICRENLGISTAAWDELSQKIDTVFHSAATIHLNLPYEEAREINLQGTKRVLAFAAKCQENKVLQRFNHVSSAYVAGKNKRFGETDFDIGQEFNNTYEQTKLESELEVLKYSKKGLPVMIFRPSIITGNYQTGEAAKSSITFFMIQRILKGNFMDFICNDDSDLNIVPVDYVVDAMLHISKSDANLGKAFNLTNQKNRNIKQMIISTCQLLNRAPLRIYPIENAKEASEPTRKALANFLDYLAICHTFDDTLAEKALQGSKIKCPVIDDDFSAKLLEYAKRGNMPSAERKWLKYYKNIPHNIEYPSISITELMYERANKYHNYLALKYTQGGLTHVEKFDEFATNIELTAKMLKANGVKQGDRVIVLLPYLPESYHTVYAVFALGAVLVPLHPQESKNPVRLAGLIKDVAASFIICLDTCVADLKQLLSRDETVANFIQRVLFITPLDSLIENGWKSMQSPLVSTKYSQSTTAPPNAEPKSAKFSPFAREIKAAKRFQGKITADIKGDDEATILFTSGTSGKKPDGCIHTHNAFNSAAMSAHEICFVEPGMKSIAVPGLFHCFGLNAATHAFLINGITQIVVPNPKDFKNLAKTQKRERAEVQVNVPLMLTKMRDSGLFDDVPYDNAVLFLTGGNGMSAGNLKYWGDKLPKGIGVTEGYGSTQTLSAGSINLPHKKKAKSIGVPYPDYFFKLIDSETDLEIREPFKIGEIYIAGPSLLKGLLNDPDPPCIVYDANGVRWYKSGDLAYFDEEHFFFFVDRKDDVLNMNDGNLVNPLEIRNVLAQYGFEEPVIFRKTDAENEYDRIVVCLESSMGDEELKELRLALQKSFAAGLRGYEIPSEVVILNNYPLSLAGKPLKKAITELYDSGNYQKKLLIK